MSLINYNPWQDAAQYGAGLGSTLSQGLLQLPMERYQLALQQRQQQTQLQEVMARLAVQQQIAQSRQAYQQQRLGQEQAVNDVRIPEMQAQTAHLQSLDQPKAQSSKFQFVKEVGLPMDVTTGRWGSPPPGSGQGGATQQGLSNTPGTATALGDVTRVLSGFLSQPSLQTNYPGLWQQTTNAYPQMLQKFLPQGTNMPPQAQGASNRIGRFLVSPVQ